MILGDTIHFESLFFFFACFNFKLILIVYIIQKIFIKYRSSCENLKNILIY